MAKMTAKKDIPCPSISVDGEHCGCMINQKIADEITRCFNAWQEVEKYFNENIRNGPLGCDEVDTVIDIVGNNVSPPKPRTVGDLEPGGGVEVTLMGSAEYIYTRPILSDLMQAVIPDDKVVLLRQNDGEMTLWSANRLCELVKK